MLSFTGLFDSPSSIVSPRMRMEQAKRFYNSRNDAAHLDDDSRIHRMATISAFVIFLKSLFGVTLLFQPRILEETGLALGSLVHSFIILCCGFACFLLLQARYMAKQQLPALESSGEIQPQTASPTRRASKTTSVFFGVRDRLITYGDLARQLLGRRMATAVTIIVLLLHIIFASGMIDTAIRYLYMFRTGRTENGGEGNDYYDDDGWRRFLEDEDSSGSSSANSPYRGFYSRHPVARFILTAAVFPFVVVLLQIRGLPQMFSVSAVGLGIYFVGCVGTMLLSATIVNNGDGSHDSGDGQSNEMWEWKWRGIPAFVASTVYAIEGINLALPTANTIVGDYSKKEHQFSVGLVMAAVFSYGALTLAIAWVGYIGGLGGGPESVYGDDVCRYISYCLGSPLLTKIYQLSLSLALLLTLPVILYPSTELLEMWLKERELKRRKKLEQLQTDASRESNSTTSSNMSQHYICADDFLDGAENFLDESDDDDESKDTNDGVRLSNHRKLRFLLSVIVCGFAFMEGYLYSVISLFRGMGLSFVGFCLPPIIYYSAAKNQGDGKISNRVMYALAGLFLFGVFNMALVAMSIFLDIPLDSYAEGPGRDEHDHDQ